MAIEVFNRYEKKYMLDEVTFKRLLDRISDYMEPDKYNKNGQFYSISNIYYDTDDNRLIRSSIEKPMVLLTQVIKFFLKLRKNTMEL